MFEPASLFSRGTMTMDIQPFEQTTLGAVVTGIDLNQLSETEWASILNAFHSHAALLFPGQYLSAEAQTAFGQRFGEIEPVREKDKSFGISNRKEDGSVYKADDFRFKALRGNEGWHHDSTYMPVSAKAGLLSAIEVPETGGETELADMRAAYEALTDDERQQIAGLEAYHSLYASQAKIGHIVESGAGYGYGEQGAPLRPLVKTHPVTGQPCLCIGRHAHRIPGMGDDAAQALLDELLDNACQPPRVYSHRWTPGDLLIWDNRCVLHRARPYDFSEARVLQGTRIAGDPATEWAPSGEDKFANLGAA